eukprot:CAMPEP_0167802700 /NCGR_PEP_ID=MMETSP0111_2-20121227/19300_1 /TAXON_ID=91324 /ORGANISM="Lotharella globosa, Strain CCCM811" /LENGTH=435 /DNA_ID=CAMNT_0007698835 /DNA_START=17 /DNA_END=1324 /DNA_ORIENTATION=-
MLFSATLHEQVTQLVDLSLQNPIRISVDAVSVVDTLSQEFVRVRAHNDNQQWREACVLALCKRSFKEGRGMIFLPSKKLAHRMMIIFGLAKLKAAELHGQLTQQQRLNALELFHRGHVDFLLATDLASRGLDIKKVRVVINYSMPKILARYIHRVGRTARAGHTGKAVTLVGENGRKNLRAVVKMAKEVTKSRVVPAAVINKWKKAISGMEEDISAVIQMEYEEKQLRKAEMESNKGINLITYKDEIERRPAKSWFQSEKEKKRIKDMSKAAYDGLDGKRMEERPEDDGGGAPKKKKQRKDPLKGLSRSKKRRKLQRMQEEKERARYAKEMEAVGGTMKKPASQRQDEAARKAKAKRRLTKEQLDGPKGDDAPPAAPVSKRIKKRYRNQPDEDQADSFARRYSDVKAEPKQQEKKKFHPKSRKAFKSKGRYKRRK